MAQTDDDVDAMLSALLEEDSPRLLAGEQLWGESVFVQALSAAMSEYKAYADAAPGLPTPLDREAQLLASPLWYAPPAPPKVVESKKRSHTGLPKVAQPKPAEDAFDEEEEYHRNGNASADMEESVDEADGEEMEEGEPYFNSDEYEPVSPRLSQHVPAILSTDIPFPVPPSADQAIPQNPSVLGAATSEEALQNALHAWYAAGYAAAVYHVKSGMLDPSKQAN